MNILANIWEHAREWVSDWFEVLCPLGAIAVIVGLLASATYESPAYRAQLYGAWCKANHRTDVSFPEWQTLRNEHLLPGQPPASESAETIITVIPK